jgi:hypothetical protein
LDIPDKDRFSSPNYDIEGPAPANERDPRFGGHLALRGLI